MGTDLSIEITRFTVKSEEQIYDPEHWLIREICVKAAVKTILGNIIRDYMTEPRHIHAKIQFNKKLTASIIYNLCHKHTVLGVIFTFQLWLSGTSQRVSQRARDENGVWNLILFTCLADQITPDSLDTESTERVAALKRSWPEKNYKAMFLYHTAGSRI